MCCEISHKVLRQETILDLMQRCQSESDFKDRFTREVCGSIVITKYNNRTYRLDDIDWTKSPLTTFKFKERDITFAEYYKKRYDIDIRDLRQPLLISNPKVEL